MEEVLSQADADLPFALLYVVERGKPQLVSCVRLARGSAAAPEAPALDAAVPWPLASVMKSQQAVVLDDLGATVGVLPGGRWPEPSTRALVLPVPIADAETTGVLIAGLSPLLPLDDEYRSFLELLARQISASIASARAHEQEIERAEKLAELDRAKTDFFSNVSHEFRTPLTLILGPVEDALARPTRSLAGKQLELVRRNALRLYKMVNTLLDFSRMEAGRAQATFVPTDLAAFTKSIASQFQSSVDRATLSLVIDCKPLPEAVYVDPELWEKVVLNLISNALKYTHRGEIRVELAWHDGQAILTVQDTGVGIAEDELDRVFERIFPRARDPGPQLRGHRHRPRPGAGAGPTPRRHRRRRERPRRRLRLHGAHPARVRTPAIGPHRAYGATALDCCGCRARSSRKRCAGRPTLRETMLQTSNPRTFPRYRSACALRGSCSSTTTLTCARMSPACSGACSATSRPRRTDSMPSSKHAALRPISSSPT